MTKKIAVINDLSGLGRCSLTAAISVLSAMGIQACPLPTAILSSQTEYPSYYCYDFTDKMDYFRQEWKKLGTSFSGIYTGYVASVCQIEQIMHFLDTFQTADTFLLVDPVMGDDGVTYDMYTSGLLTAMKELVARADVITPNLTDSVLLTDIDYNSLQDPSLSIQQLISRLKDAGQTLTKDHEKRSSSLVFILLQMTEFIRLEISCYMALHIFFRHIPVATEVILVRVISLLFLHHRRTCQRYFPYGNDADRRFS